MHLYSSLYKLLLLVVVTLSAIVIITHEPYNIKQRVIDMEDITGIGKIATSISEVYKATLDKMENAVSVIYNDTNYKVRKEAEKKYIDRITNDGTIDEVVKLALVTNHKQIFKEAKNKNDILGIALSKLTAEAEPKQVADDWLSYFFDNAKNISDENIQIVWGNILANEINTPGSVPKNLIHILSVISNEEAKNFNILCRYHVIINGKYDLLYPEDENLRKILSFTQLTELVKLGLISYRPDTGFIKVFDDQNDIYEFEILGKCYLLKSTSKENGRICFKFGDVILTRDGQTLCDAIHPVPAENIVEIIKNYYASDMHYELSE